MDLTGRFKVFGQALNVLDLGIGIVLGSAFGKIVNELINSTIIPPISQALFGSYLNSLKLVLVQANETSHTVQKALAYGAAMQWLLNCMVTAFCILVMLKAISALRLKATSRQSV